MRILFVDTYYPKFFKDFTKNNPGVNNLSYKKHLKSLFDTNFGTSDFFSSHFRKLDWKTEDIIANDEKLQRKWAKENSVKVGDNWLISRLQNLQYAYRFLGRPKWVKEIALAQIKNYKPDVVYMQDLSILNPETLKAVKKNTKLLVGQIASPLPPKENLKCFDLIITSFPHYVKVFRKMGIKSKYHKLAFEPGVLKKVGKQKRIYPVTFVGSFTPHHSEGTKILEEVANNIPVHVWGHGLEFLSSASPLRENYHGQAWGLEMYKVLVQSKIVINRHIKVADGYANNMRLYEATGMGAMLITDSKKNLNDLFKIGKEVIVYKSADDLIEKIKYFSKNDKKRREVAKQGQKRVLIEHNYEKRMRELSVILKQYL